jgi:hypothetical protein
MVNVSAGGCYISDFSELVDNTIREVKSGGIE